MFTHTGRCVGGDILPHITLYKAQGLIGHCLQPKLGGHNLPPYGPLVGIYPDSPEQTTREILKIVCGGKIPPLRLDDVCPTPVGSEAFVVDVKMYKVKVVLVPREIGLVALGGLKSNRSLAEDVYHIGGRH